MLKKFPKQLNSTDTVQAWQKLRQKYDIYTKSLIYHAAVPITLTGQTYNKGVKICITVFIRYK